MIRLIVQGAPNGETSYQELAGLSTDTKPTAGLATGSIFVEVDSGAVFFFDEASGDWVEQFSFQS